MQDSLGEALLTVGTALVSRGPGAGELIVALLVALAFGSSAVQTLFSRHRNGQDWRERHF